jgi:hypothetical protein
MEVFGGNATQYRESEKCTISFLPKSGGRTLRVVRLPYYVLMCTDCITFAVFVGTCGSIASVLMFVRYVELA